MPPDDAATRWAWMGLSFLAPAGWAAARHDVRREAGRLVLVDRRRQRLQMTWSALPAGVEPDPAALAADWRKRIEAAAGGEAAPPLTPLATAPSPGSNPDPIAWAGWFGPAGGSAGGTRTDAVAAVGGLLIDLVLIDPPKEAPPEAPPETPGPGPSRPTLRLLGSAAPATLPDGVQRWSAAGVEAAAPPGWSASLFRHEPAATVLGLSGPDRRTARVWRRGMASSWFDGDAAGLLAGSTPAGVAATPAGPGRAEAAGPEPCRPWPRLFGRARHRRDLLWHDPAQNAVLGVTVRGPRGVGLPDPAALLPPPPPEA